MRIKGVFIAFAALIAMSSSAMPAPQKPASMIVGSVTSQPIGHYEFCERHTDECGATRNSGSADLNASTWALVNQINLRVNRTITPATDMEVYGQEEYWEYPKTAGDCEDFALLKRKLLIQKGFSAANLLMTVVRKPDGEGHAVLTLRTKQGDFILDNLEDGVKLWSQTPYTYLKRQASYNAGRWVTIENGNDLLVGAVR